MQKAVVHIGRDTNHRCLHKRFFCDFIRSLFRMRSVWLEGPARLPLMPVRMLLIPVCHGFNFLSSIKSHSFSFLSNFSYFFTYIFVIFIFATFVV